MTVKQNIFLRAAFVFSLMFVFAIAIVYKVYYIQQNEGEELRKIAEVKSFRKKAISGIRGNIYADDGSLLATSVPEYIAYWDLAVSALTPSVFESGIDSLAYLFATTFKDKTQPTYVKEFRRAYRQKKRAYILGQRLSHQQVKVMSTWPLLRNGRYKGGFYTFQSQKRILPFQLLAQRTIGTTRSEKHMVGIEKAFDQYLSPTKGIRIVVMNAGVEVPISDQNVIDPENGKDIITTIDINLQDVAEYALLEALQKHKAQSGCAVLMEVKTGHIKAIANLSKVGDDQYAEIMNHAVRESAEQGSTLKLVSLIALLEKGIQLQDSVDAEGGITKFYNQTMKDAEQGFHHMMTLQQAFESSSNVGIAKMVQSTFGNKAAEFIDFYDHLALAKPIGFQLVGEGVPKILKPSDKAWSGVTLPWMSIGYESTFTPLQILTLYNAIANEGKMIKPILVSEVREAGKKTLTFESEVLQKRICSRQTLDEVKKALEGVVIRGSAKGLRTPNYKIAGKTGTAQILAGGQYSKEFYKSSFVGYFPADQPMYTCIVSINGASNGEYYGSKVAGPVFREIADKVYASSLSVHKDITYTTNANEIETPSFMAGYMPEIANALDQLGIANRLTDEKPATEWVKATGKAKVVQMTGVNLQDNKVPDVVGMSLKDALFLLENRGLKVVCTGSGKVQRQSLEKGSLIKRGSVILITLK